MKYILSFMALWLVACQSANPYEDKTIALVPLKTFPLPKISVRAMQLLSLTSKTKGLSLTFVR